MTCDLYFSSTVTLPTRNFDVPAVTIRPPCWFRCLQSIIADLLFWFLIPSEASFTNVGVGDKRIVSRHKRQCADQLETSKSHPTPTPGQGH